MTVPFSARSVGALVRNVLPEGRLLSEDVWQRRHRMIVRIAGLQAMVMVPFALALGTGLVQSLVAGAVIAVPLVLAVPEHLSRHVRSSSATVSLFFASAVLVQVTHGLTESHFHFFVMVGVVALYQDWVPFGIGLLITVLHHGLLGTLHPHAVFAHESAYRSPWVWAGIHGGFVLAASAAHLASWRLNEQQGLRDPLTGLANRTLFSETLIRALERQNNKVSVLFVDLDDFKQLNDTQGHAAGDDLLEAVAERLRGCVRAGDLIARLGGDEFALLVTGDGDVALGVADRILKALSDPAVIGGRPVTVRASIGIADTRSAPERDAEILLRNADLAMYLAKAGGKHRVEVFRAGMDEAARARVELADDLRGAMAAGQFEVFYQPTITLADGAMGGSEALLRWRHPTRGMVGPDQFIPLAEANGMIVEIGEWVLRTAIQQAADWTAQEGRPIEVAVNLSTRQLANDDIIAVVSSALEESGLPAEQLILEITESVLVSDLDTVAQRLTRLRLLGVRVAIDDFGTGYSSLSYLRRLPVDSIKIDRSFIRDLPAGGSAATLVSSIIELARSLSLDVVAEGVETEQQAHVLRDLNVDLVQGYLFARPTPAGQTPFGVMDEVPALPAPRDATDDLAPAPSIP